MKIFLSLMVLSLVGLALGAPTSSEDDEVIVVSKDFFSKDSVIYSGKHKIVNLIVPLNGLNHDNDTNDSSEYSPNSNEIELNILMFFVEADVDSYGNRVDRGLYVLRNGKATKILENGRDAAASRDDSNLAFFGAKDGIYVYDYATNSAKKYGTVDDSIICIGKEETGDVIYILTENHEMFKVSNGGMVKEKLNDVVGARQFVLDLSNNIYFYTEDKQAYVRTADGVKKIEGLPQNPSSVTLVNPPLFLYDDAVPFVVDNSLYFISVNGTTDDARTIFEPKAKPSAYAPEAFVIQYYAYNKKIYEFNLIAKIYEGVMGSLDSLIENNVDKILAAAKVSKRPRQHQRV
ncbi:uncharacterized protein LOC124540769 [Vanessa cardui]|uniref:uncharacterized protein LOC124540769 n=1 Tax=Vanessa cardui TaxID=171605 RepID=UPI001F143EAE|nr:uncharacterized protein LOC124540769 [Vanessa cardui]